jgi:hypothetical protein
MPVTHSLVIGDSPYLPVNGTIGLLGNTPVSIREHNPDPELLRREYREA